MARLIPTFLCLILTAGSAHAEDCFKATIGTNAPVSRVNPDIPVPHREHIVSSITLSLRIITLNGCAGSRDAIIYLHGDLTTDITRSINGPMQETTTLHRALIYYHLHAKRLNVAIHFVARYGYFGSEGDPRFRFSRNAFMTTSLAIDRLLDLYGIEKAAIVGHSGGAHDGLAHAVLSGDIRAKCYVLASGRYAAQTPLFHDGQQYVLDLPVRVDRKFIFMADPRDTAVPHISTATLAPYLIKKGHNVVSASDLANPPNYHDFSPLDLQHAVRCLRGEPIRG